MLREKRKKLRSLLKRVRGQGYKLLHPAREQFECPVCEYVGPFMDADDSTGLRLNAMCPSCSGLERHRVLILALNALPETPRFSQMSLLHFAPEPELETLFRKRFGKVTTADLDAPGVDHHVDLRGLPFEDASYDVVIAAHVLEHIREDNLAFQEIRRILKPGGVAVLQVPTLGERTVEYPEPNPHEWGHVRSPGEDYFDTRAVGFSKVVTYRSSQFDKHFQPYIFEDRSAWPKEYPLRQTTAGERHNEFVSICYA